MKKQELQQFASMTSLNLHDALNIGTLKVPENQRSFDWSTANFQDYWDSIYAQLASDSKRPHFLGPTFLRRDDNISTEYEIFDGQQRFTTTVCFCAVLRAFNRFVDNEEVRETNTRLLESMLRDDEGTPRVTIDRANEYFKEQVIARERGFEHWRENKENSPGREIGKSSIDEAMDFFSNRVFEYLLPFFLTGNQEHFDNSFKNLVNVSITQVFVAQTVVNDLVLLENIFESLNAAGLQLSIADLVKNSLLRKKPEKERKDIIRKWEEMLDVVDDLAMQDHPSHTHLETKELILYSYHRRGEVITSGELNKKVRADLGEDLNFSVRKFSAGELAARFLEDSKYFQKFLTLSTDDEVKSVIHRLKRKLLWKNHMTPFFMEFIHHVEKRDLNPKEQLWCLALIESVLFRVAIIGLKPTPILKMASDATSVFTRLIKEKKRNCQQIYHPDNSELPKFMQIFETNLSDSKFEERLINGNNKTLNFYIVWSLEKSMNKSNGQNYEPFWQSPKQHLEHILPQKWASHADWSHIKDEEDTEVLLHKFGNCLVLEALLNKQISNKGFEIKDKGGYKESDLKMPSAVRDFLQGDQWTSGSIASRTESLAKNECNKWWSLDAATLEKNIS